MIKFIISILSIFLTIGYAMALFDYGIIDYHTSRFYYFIIGAMAFIPIWYLWLKKVSFYSTFEHELTHLLVGLIFFKKPTNVELFQKNKHARPDLDTFLENKHNNYMWCYLNILQLKDHMPKQFHCYRLNPKIFHSHI